MSVKCNQVQVKQKLQEKRNWKMLQLQKNRNWKQKNFLQTENSL